MKARSLVAVGSGDEYDARYPELAEERRRLGAESLVALPLRNARGEVIGAISATSRRENWATGERRPLLLGIAEQTGVALERARLQTDAERAAEDSSFLALFGESLERATTVEGRARRIVEELIDRRATFAAVHLVDEEGVVAEVASGGSRPAELDDDEEWAEWVERVVAGGREVRPPVPESSPADPRVPSLVVLPLRARGHSLGALTLRAAPGPNWKPVIARPSRARSPVVRRSPSTTRSPTRRSGTCRTRSSSGCSAERCRSSRTSSSRRRTAPAPRRSRWAATGTTPSRCSPVPWHSSSATSWVTGSRPRSRWASSAAR